jgi:cold shock CspA family protein
MAMPHTGVLRSWHDERGFGFIAPTQGGAEIFVHIGAFPRDGTRPTVGERLGYELAPGRDGKPQAVSVTRLALGADRPTRAPSRRDDRTGASVLGTIVVVVLLTVLGAWAYRYVSTSMHRTELAAQPALRSVDPVRREAHPVDRPAPASFSCDGRTHCSQMTSCAEATWFINHCPGTEMDGNRDGVPCEQQWCNSLLSR